MKIEGKCGYCGCNGEWDCEIHTRFEDVPNRKLGLGAFLVTPGIHGSGVSIASTGFFEESDMSVKVICPECYRNP